MFAATNSDNEPESQDNRHLPSKSSPKSPKDPKRGRFLWLWGGGLLLVSLAGGIGYGWFFLSEKLAPLIERELTEFLDRPVEVGELEGFSLTGVRFGESKILGTDRDPARVLMNGVAVTFDPIELLTQRKLNLTVTAIEPDIYVQQGKNRSWLLTKFKSDGKGQSAIEIDLETLRLQDAEIVLVARSPETGELQTPVKAFVDSGKADFFTQANAIEFDLTGQLAKGGKLAVSGIGMTKTEEINLVLRGNNVQATDINHLIVLPMDVKTGTIDGNLEVQIRPDRVPLLRGVASLEGVTLAFPGFPQPFSQGNGQLRFRDSEIRLEDVTTHFGSLVGTVNGAIDLEKGYTLQSQIQPLSVREVIQSLKFNPPPVPIAGEVRAKVSVTGELDKPILDVDLTTTKQARVDKIDFRNISANLRLQELNLSISRVRAFPTVGGQLTGTGNIQFTPPQPEGKKPESKYVFDIRAVDLPAQAIARTYQTTLPVKLGLVSGQTRLTGILEKPETLRATGLANFPLGGGTVDISNFQYAAKQWQADVRASKVTLTSLSDNLSPQIRQEKLDGVFQVSGTLQPEDLRATGIANITLAGGLVRASDLSIANGGWSTDLSAQNVQISRLFPDISEQLAGNLQGDFNLAGSLDGSLESIRGRGNGRLALSQGSIVAETVTLSDGNFEARLTPENLALAPFSPDLRGRLEGNIEVAGNFIEPSPDTIRAKGDLRFTEGLGFIEEPLTTYLIWTGKRLEIDRATTNNITAKGWADLDLEQLNGLSAVNYFELQVVAQGLDLKTLPIPLPSGLEKLDYAAGVDFNGTIAGIPANPRIEGSLGINNFQVGAIAFEPVLKGTIAIVPQEGVNLDLAGNNDTVRLTLDSQYQPTTFAVRLDDMTATGSRRNGELIVQANDIGVGTIKDFAIAMGVSIPESIAAQPISGDLSGTFIYDLKTADVAGSDIAIANPRFGTLKGDRLTADFRYREGDFILSQGLFQSDRSQYSLQGSVTQSPQGPRLYAKVDVAEGQIQDVLTTLQIFELSDFSRGLGTPPDYSKATALYDSEAAESSPPSPLFSIGLPEASILNQLNRLSEIEALLRIQRQQRKDSSPLPELRDLEGTFNGSLVVNATPVSGLEANFGFEGQAWQWGDYRVEQVIARGNLKNGILYFDPVSLRSGNQLVAFSGNLGGNNQTGELQLVDVPLELISEFIDLPSNISFGGLLDGTVKLAGNLDNPDIRGNVTVGNGTINQTPIFDTQGSFFYHNSRLHFAARSALTQEAEPLTVQGSLPYILPFATAKPDSDRLILNVGVKNEGLTLLNILTYDAISWIDGTGEVQLQISGKFDPVKGTPRELRAEGIARAENATIAAQVLPDAPLTDVNGKISFDFDHIDVESFSGNFSGGRVTVAGTLPLVQPTPQQNPLTVNLEDLAFTLKGLYQGGVDGQIQITGSALEPDLGGEIDLFDGQILLGEETAENGSAGNGNGEEGIVEATEYRNLKLNLGKNIQIARPPILNFLAAGSLNLNGRFYEPRPQGTIQLEAGQVNLFASQLRLAGGAAHTAEFFPNRGLDPYLNVELVTSATETVRSTVRTNPLSSEISDPLTSNLDSLQTIRIRARVEGFASQLTNSIELTSTPTRSQTEIVTLLGGGFVNTLGRGDTTLGLANLAGSAVFGSFQQAIGDALGLSEFRIFPTPLIDDRERISSVQLGIGAEASIDLDENLSVSVQKILNSDRAPQFGIRYRLNDHTVIRGSSNFSDDSRGVIEYERRF